jgi:hypothetical protein
LSNTAETFEGLVDLLLKEQILNSVSRELALFLRERVPETAYDMAMLAEQYSEARHGYLGSQETRPRGKDHYTGSYFKGRSPLTRSGTTEEGSKGHKESHAKKEQVTPPDRPRFVDPRDRLCFICQRKGHIARDCRARPRSHEIGVCYTIGVCTGDEGSASNYVTVSHQGRPVTILRDTGSTCAVIKRSLLPEGTVLDQEGSYKAIDGNVGTAPMGKVYLHTPYYTGETEVMVFDNPVYDVVIGDIPGARTRENPNPDWENLEVKKIAAVETRGQRLKASQGRKPLLTADIEGEQVDAAGMMQAQKDDDSLAKLRELAQSKSVTHVRGNTSKFVYSNGLLMREFMSPKLEHGKLFSQLVVPQKFRKQVMRVGHEAMMSGHLATKRTMDRIQRQFYWPGMQSEIRRFCRSCDVCQRTVHKGKVTKVPLGQMPIIDTPFDRVAVDLIGPLDPVTDRKNRYILTLVDYATRYPEAVPLANIDTETVAEALVGIFSRVGVPREILTDMGTQFTSDLMKAIGRLLSLKQLTTTPYHPMCNGLVERFNGTLKSMLKKMCYERPKDWDRYVMPLLFAYREVPQESLGFSPFELLYGRTVRGPMNILRELWTQEVPDPEVRSTYQYVLDLKERLQETCQLAQTELRKSTTRYKKYYNSKAKDRKFVVGDKVLLLLPTQANKLLMQWKGPFSVVEKQGVADYRIQMGNKMKTFHANLLRRYIERADVTSERHEIAAMIIEEGEDVDVHTVGHMEPPALEQTQTFEDVHLSPDLTPTQTHEVKELLSEFREVLSDLPGRTNLEEIHLDLTTTEPVRSKVYQVPYHLRETVKKEVESMLDLGVIEPSKSAYVSPIVLIKKKDGEYRFCSDFRQVNKITVFDAEPIPNPEALFSQLSKAKFYTKIDLSRGYWQIGVDKESRQYTAFVTPQGLFQWKVMPFGLVNAPAVFSRMMRKLLQGLDDVMNYIDDILIYTETWEDHVKAVRQVLDRLRLAGLTAKPGKCFLAYANLEYLGHMVGNGELKPEESKVDKILNMARPQNKKQIRSFLGMIGYYRKFIPHFSTLAAPLTNMTRKGAPNQLEWTPSEVQSLENLKRSMATAPILRLPDMEKALIVRTDASDTGLGAVMLQEHDGEKFPVLFLSRKLNGAEKAYATIEKECLAIVWAIDKLKHYLIGKEFQLETDHKPLTWLHQAKITNSRIMRWALLLQSYRFVLCSIPGVDNHGADLLSRCGGASN